VAQAKPLAATITPLVQRAPSDPLGSFEPGADFAARLSSSGGSPLPAGTRAFMEPRFGADFSGVRLHTGSTAAQLNRAVSAQAFTHGRDIYLGAGTNNLESSTGKQLLAHELAHTIQQGAAGTHDPAVQRARSSEVAGGLIQRSPAPTPTEAADSSDPDKVSAVEDAAWANASNRDRRRAIHVLLSKSIMFSWNDATVVRIINSYPDRDAMEKEDVAAIEAAVARGSVHGGELTGYWPLVRSFERVVIDRARSNVKGNLVQLDEMAKKFGLGREAEGGASGTPSALDNLQMVAGRVADVRHFQIELRRVQIGWKPIGGSAGLLPSNEPVRFDPDRPPAGPAAAGALTLPSDLAQGIMPWSDVKRVYDTLDVQVGKILSANPALYLLAATPALDQRLISNDDRLHFGRSALAGFETTSSEQAHKELLNAHQRATQNLRNVQAKLGDSAETNTIDVASLDALGLRVAQLPSFSSPFAHWATTHAVETAKTRKEQISAFLDFATAAMLVGATIGTLGGAAVAVAVLTGASAAGAIASAGVKLSNAADLKATADAGIRPEDRLTSQAKVSAAELEAAIATAIAILSAVAVAKGIKGVVGLGFRRAASTADDLRRLGELSPARAAKVVQQSIREVGVVQTAEQAGFGNDVYQLYRYLPEGSPEAPLVLETALQLRQQTAKAALSEPSFLGRRVTPTDRNYTGWHGNTVTPTQLRAVGGFKAKGTNGDLYEHMLARGKPSQYMGTTRIAQTHKGGLGAAAWADEGGWVYHVEADEAWDIERVYSENQHLVQGSTGNPVAGEMEVAVRANIPWERIRGWHEVLPGGKLGPYVKRAEFEAGKAVP
jgi:hypothetical protein